MKPSHLRIQWWVNSKGGKNLEPHQGVKPWHTVPLHSWSSYCHSKILNLLNPETEHTQLVNILCDKLGNTHKAFLWHTERYGERRKSTWTIIWVTSWVIFTEQVFCFKELTNWLFRLDYIRYFLRNEWSLLLQEK